MIIDSLYVQNFRQFSSRVFNFHPSFNVFVGASGTGKTHLLDALSIVLGTVQSGVSRSLYTRRIKADERCTSFDGAVPKDSEVSAYIKYGSVTAHVAQKWGQDARRSRCCIDSRLTDPFKEAYDASYHDRGPAHLPLLAYYGLGRISPLKQKAVLPEQPQIRLHGYRHSLEPDRAPQEIPGWLSRHILAGETYALHFLRRAVSEFFPLFDRFRHEDGRNYLCFRGRPDQPLEILSGEERSLLYLLMGMTRRLSLLHPHEEDLSQLSGVVLIDELDLLLSPQHQQGIVPRLRGLFPRIQFIVTARSPLILSTLPKECVKVLLSTATYHPCEQTQGARVSDLLTDLFDAFPTEERYSPTFNK